MLFCKHMPHYNDGIAASYHKYWDQGKHKHSHNEFVLLPLTQIYVGLLNLFKSHVLNFNKLVQITYLLI